jgi:molybdopterin converting factor small subunit
MMEVQLISFGALTDITGSGVLGFAIPRPAISVAELMSLLFVRYPALEGKTFRIAVNERFVDEKFTIGSGDIVALMPPFSGG